MSSKDSKRIEVLVLGAFAIVVAIVVAVVSADDAGASCYPVCRADYEAWFAAAVPIYLILALLRLVLGL